MTPLVPTPKASPAEASATAPQGTVTQVSHKYVTKPNPPSLDATSTLNSGEAD